MINKVNKAQIIEAWKPMVIAATKGATLNESRLEWMAEYAHNHVQALNEDAQVYNSNGLAYNNLFNTMGIGNPMPAQTAGVGGAEQAAQSAIGSADKWPALLPIALQVAGKTVGFDLVNTTPFANPTGVIPYLDYVYSNSKQPGGQAPYAQTGRLNPELVAGEKKGSELYDMPAMFVVTLVDAEGKVLAGADKKAAVETFAAAAELDVNGLKLEYVGKTRVDAQPIFRPLVDADTFGKSLLSFFDGELKAQIAGVDVMRPRLVSMLENHVLGYAGAGKYDTGKWQGTWADGNRLFEPMDRATGETQYARQLSLEMFTKFVTVGTQQIAIGCTLDMVTDLNKQWGINVMNLLENAGVNEMSQSMNKHILSRLFALGWKNHIKAWESEGINLNMTYAAEAETPAFGWYDENGVHDVDTDGGTAMEIPAMPDYGQFENRDTMLKRIFTQLLAAGNVITQRGRRGPANFAVTNLKIATAMQANAQYGFSPVANTVNQTNGSLYPVGTVGGMTIYVDPNMAYEDTRVLVGRKGDKDEPGVHFCPYLIADKISTIAEATMAPKMLIRSRYALVDVGWYPETQYLTFWVGTAQGPM